MLGDAISRAKLQAHEYKEDVVSQAQAEYEQAMHNAQAVALDNLHQLAFRTGLGNSIYASPDISVSHQQAVSYANQALGSSSNMAVIADNIRSSTLKSLVGEHFDVKASSTLSAPASQYYGGEARINFHGENLLSVGFKAGPLADPAYLVLQHLLGGEPAVKWTQGTSNFAANANGAQSFYYGYSDAGIIGFNVAAADPSKTSEIAQKAVAQIKRVASGDVKDEEVKRAISKAKFAAASTLDHRLSALEVTGAQVRQRTWNWISFLSP